MNQIGEIIVKEMETEAEKVLAGIKQGHDIENIQEVMGIDDPTMFDILLELVRLDKIRVVVA